MYTYIRFIYKYNNNRSVSPRLARVDDTHASTTRDSMFACLSNDAENATLLFFSCFLYVYMEQLRERKKRSLRIAIVSMGSS